MELTCEQGQFSQELESPRVGTGRRRVSERQRDAKLIDRVKAGDRAAFQQLVEKYQARAYRIAFEIVGSKEDAEDVIQESFVKAYLSLDKFRQQAAFYTWFYRIVYNMAIDARRRRARRGGTPAEYDDELLNKQESNTSTLGSVETPESSLYRKEQSARISAALQTISEEHRAVITLREFDGLSYDDIARVTGVTRGTVMSRLHYARKRLQAALKDLRPGIDDGSEDQVADRDALQDVSGLKNAGGVSAHD